MTPNVEMMKGEISREDAISLYASDWWQDLTYHEIARLQLGQKLLCLPFDIFHRSVELAIGEGVWTHEFIHPEILLARMDAANTGHDKFVPETNEVNEGPKEAPPLGNVILLDMDVN